MKKLTPKGHWVLGVAVCSALSFILLAVTVKLGTNLVASAGVLWASSNLGLILMMSQSKSSEDYGHWSAIFLVSFFSPVLVMAALLDSFRELFDSMFEDY